MTALPHLVLLHGALGSSEQLEPLARALSASYQVHLLDFEGHGAAPPRQRVFRMEHFCENVLDLLDEREIERVALFGYSMGGYVAMLLAAQYPELVERVTTLGTKFKWDPPTAAREAERLNPATIRAKVPQFAETLAQRHQGTGRWQNVVSSTAELLEHLGHNPLLDSKVLRSIQTPVTVLVGGRDNTVSVDESRNVTRVLRNATLEVLENTTHPIEQVDVSMLVEALTVR